MPKTERCNNAPLKEFLTVVGKLKRRAILIKIKNYIEAVSPRSRWNSCLLQLVTNSTVVLKRLDIKKPNYVFKLPGGSSKNNELLANNVNECTDKACEASSKRSIESPDREILDEWVDTSVASTSKEEKIETLSSKIQKCETTPTTSKMSEKHIDEKTEEINERASGIINERNDNGNSEDAVDCSKPTANGSFGFSAPDETEIVEASPIFGAIPLSPKKSVPEPSVESRASLEKIEKILPTETISVKSTPSKNLTTNGETSSTETDKYIEQHRSSSSSSTKRRDSREKSSTSSEKSHSGEKSSKREKSSGKSSSNHSSSHKGKTEHRSEKVSSKSRHSEKSKEETSKSSLVSSHKSREKESKSSEKSSSSSSHRKSGHSNERSSTSVKDSTVKKDGSKDDRNSSRKQDKLKKVVENNSEISSKTLQNSPPVDATNSLAKRLQESPYTESDKIKILREKEKSRRHSTESVKDKKLVSDDLGRTPREKKNGISSERSPERHRRHTHHDRSSSSKRSRESSSESRRHSSKDSDRVHGFKISTTSSSRIHSSSRSSASSPERKFLDDSRAPTRIGSSKKPRISRVTSENKDPESPKSSYEVSSRSPTSSKDEILARTIKENKKCELKEFSKRFKIDSQSMILKRKRKEFERLNNRSNPLSEFESDIEEGEIPSSRKIRKFRESSDSDVFYSENVNSKKIHEPTESILTSDDFSSLDSHNPLETLEERFVDVGVRQTDRETGESKKNFKKKRRDEKITNQCDNEGNTKHSESIESFLAGMDSSLDSYDFSETLNAKLVDRESNGKHNEIAKSTKSPSREKRNVNEEFKKSANEDKKKINESAESSSASLKLLLGNNDEKEQVECRLNIEVESAHKKIQQSESSSENEKKKEKISTESKKDKAGDYLQRQKNKLHRDLIKLDEKERLSKEQGDILSLPPSKKTKKSEMFSMPSLNEIPLNPPSPKDLSAINEAVPVPEDVLENLEQQINTEIYIPIEIVPSAKNTDVLPIGPRTPSEKIDLLNHRGRISPEKRIKEKEVLEGNSRLGKRYPDNTGRFMNTILDEDLIEEGRFSSNGGSFEDFGTAEIAEGCSETVINHESGEFFSNLQKNSEIQKKNLLGSKPPSDSFQYQQISTVTEVSSTPLIKKSEIPLFKEEKMIKNTVKIVSVENLTTKIAGISKPVKSIPAKNEKLQLKVDSTADIKKVSHYDETMTNKQSSKSKDEIPHKKVGTIRVRNFDDLGKKCLESSGGFPQFPIIADNLRPLPFSEKMNVREADRATNQIIEDLALYFNVIFWCKDSLNINTGESIRLNQSSNRMGLLIVKYFDLLAKKKNETDWNILAESVMEAMKKKALPYQTQLTEIMDVVMEFSKNGYFFERNSRSQSLFPTPAPTPVPAPSIAMYNGRASWFGHSPQPQASNMQFFSGGSVQDSSSQMVDSMNSYEQSLYGAEVSRPLEQQDLSNNYHPMPPLGLINQEASMILGNYSPSSEGTLSTSSQKSPPQRDIRNSQMPGPGSFKDIVRQSVQASEKLPSINPPQKSQFPSQDCQQNQPQLPPTIAPQKQKDLHPQAPDATKNISVQLSQRPSGFTEFNPACNNPAPPQQSTMPSTQRVPILQAQALPNWSQNYRPIPPIVSNAVPLDASVNSYQNYQMQNQINNFNNPYYPSIPMTQNAALSQQGFPLGYPPYQATHTYQQPGQNLPPRPRPSPPAFCGPNCQTCRQENPGHQAMLYPSQQSQNPRQVNPIIQNPSGYQPQIRPTNSNQNVVQMKQNIPAYLQVPSSNTVPMTYSNVTSYQQSVSQDIQQTIPAIPRNQFGQPQQINQSISTKNVQRNISSQQSMTSSKISSNIPLQAIQNMVQFQTNFPPANLPSNNQVNIATTQQNRITAILRDNVILPSYQGSVGIQQKRPLMNIDGTSPHIAENSIQYLQQMSMNPQYSTSQANNTENPLRNIQSIPVNFVGNQKNAVSFPQNIQMYYGNQNQRMPIPTAPTIEQNTSSMIVDKSQNLQGFTSLISAIQNNYQGTPSGIPTTIPAPIEQPTLIIKKNHLTTSSTIRAPTVVIPTQKSLDLIESRNVSTNFRIESAITKSITTNMPISAMPENVSRVELPQQNLENQQNISQFSNVPGQNVLKSIASNYPMEVSVGGTNKAGEQNHPLSSEVNILKAIQQLSKPEVNILLKSPKNSKVRRKTIPPKEIVGNVEEISEQSVARATSLRNIGIDNERSISLNREEFFGIPEVPDKIEENHSQSLVQNSSHGQTSMQKIKFSNSMAVDDKSPISQNLIAEKLANPKESLRFQDFSKIINGNEKSREAATFERHDSIPPQSQPTDLSTNKLNPFVQGLINNSTSSPIETPTLVISRTCSIPSHSNSLSVNEPETDSTSNKNLRSLPGSPESIDEPEIFGEDICKFPQSSDRSFETKMMQSTDFDIPSITEFRGIAENVAKFQQNESSEFNVPSIAEFKETSDSPIRFRKRRENGFELNNSGTNLMKQQQLPVVPPITEFDESSRYTQNNENANLELKRSTYENKVVGSSQMRNVCSDTTKLNRIVENFDEVQKKDKRELELNRYTNCELNGNSPTFVNFQSPIKELSEFVGGPKIAKYTSDNISVHDEEKYIEDSNSRVEETNVKQLSPSDLSQSIIDEEIECARLYPTLSLQEPEESGFVIQMVETISQVEHDAMALESGETDLCTFCQTRMIYGSCEKCKKFSYCSNECQRREWDQGHCKNCEKVATNSELFSKIKNEENTNESKIQSETFEIITLSDSDEEEEIQNRKREEEIQNRKREEEIQNRKREEEIQNRKREEENWRKEEENRMNEEIRKRQEENRIKEENYNTQSSQNIVLINIDDDD